MLIKLQSLIMLFFILFSSGILQAKESNKTEEIYLLFEMICLKNLEDKSYILEIIEDMEFTRMSGDIERKLLLPHTGKAYALKNTEYKIMLLLSDTGSCTMAIEADNISTEFQNILIPQNNAKIVDKEKSGSQLTEIYQLKQRQMSSMNNINIIVITNISTLPSMSNTIMINSIPQKAIN